MSGRRYGESTRERTAKPGRAAHAEASEALTAEVLRMARLLGTDPEALANLGTPSLAHMRQIYGPHVTEQMLDEALPSFYKRRDEYRRRSKEEDSPLSYNDAVETYRFVAPLLSEPDPESTDYRQWCELRAILAAITNPHFETGGFCFAMVAVRAIIEGFEREIDENSETLRVRHHGETEPREVSRWDRYILYRALEFFVGVIGEEPAQYTVERPEFERAQAILGALTVNKPQGPHDPRSNGARDTFIVLFLGELEGCGLDVTSSKPRASLVAAMSEVTDIPESTIAKVWEGAAGVPALTRPGKGSRNRAAAVLCLECGAPVERERLRQGRSRDRCDACADARAPW